MCCYRGTSGTWTPQASLQDVSVPMELQDMARDGAVDGRWAPHETVEKPSFLPLQNASFLLYQSISYIIYIYIYIYIIKKMPAWLGTFFFFKWRFEMLFVVEISPHPRKSDPISRVGLCLATSPEGLGSRPQGALLGRWSTETWRSPRQTFFCLRFLGLPSLPHLIG